MGKLGLSQSEFWSSSLRDLRLRMEGFFELEEDRLKGQYERDRLFTILASNIHLDKKSQYQRPIDMIVFPWEKEFKKKEVVPEKPMTPEEKKERFGKMDAYMLKKYGNSNG
jgi:hypothetical protein